MLAAPTQIAIPPAAELLTWYDRHRRVLPWRAGPGETACPYHVWLSEIMLQQTGVTAVIPYFKRFLALFADVQALAEAPEERVLQAWAGLGYYARARNLHACAKRVAELGDFPRTEAGLRGLPGIGTYTAAAIAAIAFGEPLVAVDGNVERVAARVFAIDEPLPAAKAVIARAASRLNQQLEARARAADFAQALFDLGATICTPRNPACALCPWMSSCAARACGRAATLPLKAPKKPRPLRHGAVFLLRDRQGMVLLHKRPGTGLLGGMTGMPGAPWRETAWPQAEVIKHAPAEANWERVGTVQHVFTHFALTLDVYSACLPNLAALEIAGHFLRPVSALAQEALPSLMRKCAAWLPAQTAR